MWGGSLPGNAPGGCGLADYVEVVLFNSEGLVFSCRRVSSRPGSNENWQFPQGGIDGDEEPQHAALRELAEETGIPPSAVHPVAEFPGWLTYDFDRATKERLGGKMDAYRGQKQKYFLYRFAGDEADVTLEVPGHKPEFDAWAWVPIDATPRRVAAFKVPVYEEVAREFAPIIAREVARERECVPAVAGVGVGAGAEDGGR